MLTKTQFWMGTAALLLATNSVMAEQQWVDELMETQKASGELQRSADCLGVNENKYETVLRSMLTKCIGQTGYTDDSEQCIREEEKVGMKQLGITEADVARCEQEDEEEDEYDYEEDEDY